MSETNNTFLKIKDLYSDPILKPNANESDQENPLKISNNNLPNLQNFIENGKEYTFVYDPRIKTDGGYGAYTIRPVENGLLTSDVGLSFDDYLKKRNITPLPPYIKSDYTEIDALLKPLYANNSAPPPAAPAPTEFQWQPLSVDNPSDFEFSPNLEIDPKFNAPAPTSVVQGMFPEVEAMQRALYQQKQNEAMQAQALQFARLDPFQKASYGLAMGGQQLGGAIGSALGGKDPQLQMISLQNQMLRMVDPNKPETYDKAISLALQTGDRNTALMLNDEKKNAQARKTENLQLGLQKLAQTLYKPDGSIDENVYATLQSYGAAGLAIIDQQVKGTQGLQTQKAQSLGRRLFNEDGSRNKEVEKQLRATPEGLAILKQFAPETKVFKRGDIITKIDPVTGDYEIVTPTGLRTVSAGANPIKAMIDNKAIDPTVNAFATEIANQWDNLDDKDRSNAIESLTKVNNQALDRNQKKAEAGAGGLDKVQSSKTTPDGTTILVMKNGTTKVISAQGVELKGQARADAIRASELFGAETQRTRAQERGVGELSAKQVGQAFAEVGKIKKNIGNIDEAIAAIDAGANTGVIASKLPNITAASIQLANVRQQLGLDVIGSVTFGALSEGELNLALDTALPTGLAPKDLRVYLVNKKNAQTKLAGYLSKQATYLSKPGNSLAGWLEKVDNEAVSAPSELPAGVTVKRKN